MAKARLYDVKWGVRLKSLDANGNGFGSEEHVREADLKFMPGVLAAALFDQLCFSFGGKVAAPILLKNDMPKLTWEDSLGNYWVSIELSQ
jgi:hypothetical protein